MIKHMERVFLNIKITHKDKYDGTTLNSISTRNTYNLAYLISTLVKDAVKLIKYNNTIAVITLCTTPIRDKIDEK